MTPVCINCWYYAKAKVVEGEVLMPAPSMARSYMPCDKCGTPTRYREKGTNG